MTIVTSANKLFWDMTGIKIQIAEIIMNSLIAHLIKVYIMNYFSDINTVHEFLDRSLHEQHTKATPTFLQ